MTTAYSSLLGLALPVQGELAGQWGDTVNDYITKYLDASIAGSLSITADVTLTKTTGTTLGAASSQYAILTCSPSSVNIVVTAPAAYKIYVVNNTSASYTVTIRGAGPTSGVVLAALEKAVVAWNGSDFFKVATSATDGVSTFSAGSTGLTPSSATAGAVTLAGTLAVANGGTGLTAGTSGGVLAYTAAGTLASSSALAASALVIGGGAGAAPSTTTTGTGVVTALGVNTGSAGAFVVNGGVLGTPSSGTVTNLTGTASININGTVGATTATTGAFTTVSATNPSESLTLRSGNTTRSYLTIGRTAYEAGIGVAGSNLLLGTGDVAGDLDIFTNTATGKINFSAGNTGAIHASLSTTGLNSTVIGATTPAAGSFTTLGASGVMTNNVAASAWGGNVYSVLEHSAGAIFGYQSSQFIIATNTYFTTTYKYKAAGSTPATMYNATSGTHSFYTAPDGTAGNTITFTKIAEITSTGLAVAGALSATGQLSATGSIANQLLISSSVTGDVAASIASTGGTSGSYGLRVDGGTNASDYGFRVRSKSGAATLFTVQGDGVLDLPIGQIKFPATQNASADANTLDDYEESSTVVAFSSGGGSVTIEPTWDTLNIVKIGKTVFFNGRLDVSTVSSPTGDLTLTGLPFAAAMDAGGGVYYQSAEAAWGTQAVCWRVNEATTTMTIRGTTGTAFAASCKAGTNLDISGHYTTSN